MLERSGYRAVPSPRQPGPGDQRYYRSVRHQHDEHDDHDDHDAHDDHDDQDDHDDHDNHDDAISLLTGDITEGASSPRPMDRAREEKWTQYKWR